MEICVLGSTGGVGTELVRLALERGWTVRAYARPASVPSLPTHDNLTPHPGELDDESALRAAIAGADAVVSALGPRTNSPDQPPLFEAALARVTRLMGEEGVQRLVAISGAATPLPGDPPSVPRALIRGVMKLVARHVLESKVSEAAVILATDLEWVLPRPPRIVPGPPSGTTRGDLSAPPSSKVTRGGIAEFMLSAATSDEWVRTAPFVADG